VVEINDIIKCTKIKYSDTFQSYQPHDFEQMGYILKQINNNILFGYGLMHINTIDGLYFQIIV
jgi:hypothetical protein